MNAELTADRSGSSSTMDPGRPDCERMASGRVAIVVATHQYCFPLERCISSHLEMLSSPADLIFVDNGSGGKMTAWAQERFPQITIITRERNGFFCGGYNTGMQHALDGHYEYVLIVNADTEVCNPEYVSQLVRASEQHPQAAFLGPTVYLREVGNIQNTILQYPWFARHLTHWLMSRFHATNRSAAANRNTAVDFLNGVCVLCRVDALRDVGLLDEDMGGYVEDTDWSWRARQHGWESLFVPVPGILHHQAADEYAHYSVKTFMLRRNQVYWHMKVGHTVQAHLFASFSLMLARLRAVRAICQRRDVAVHRQYVARFRDVTRRILAGDPIGDWFGPPSGRI